MHANREPQTPLTGTIRPLDTCVPNSATQSYKLSADSSNKIYVTYYANTACSGTPTTTSAPAAQACTCTGTGCTAGYVYYGTAPPTYPSSTFVLTQTQYYSASCSGAVTGLTYSIGGANCIPSACVTSATNGYTFGYTASCSTTAAPSAAPIVTNIVLVTAQVRFPLTLCPNRHRRLSDPFSMVTSTFFCIYECTVDDAGGRVGQLL